MSCDNARAERVGRILGASFTAVNIVYERKQRIRPGGGDVYMDFACGARQAPLTTTSCGRPMCGKRSFAFGSDQRIDQPHDRPLIFLRQREQLLELLPHSPDFGIVSRPRNFDAS